MSKRTGILLASLTGAIALSGCVVVPTEPGYGYGPGYGPPPVVRVAPPPVVVAPAPVYRYHRPWGRYRGW